MFIIEFLTGVMNRREATTPKSLRTATRFWSFQRTAIFKIISGNVKLKCEATVFRRSGG